MANKRQKQKKKTVDEERREDEELDTRSIHVTERGDTRALSQEEQYSRMVIGPMQSDIGKLERFKSLRKLLEEEGGEERESENEEGEGEVEGDGGKDMVGINTAEGVRKRGCSRFVKVYDPKSIFQEYPENKMMLLYPFILSKHYVDFLKHNNIFPRSLRQMMNSESTELATGSKSKEQSDPIVDNASNTPFDNLTEAQKCQKFSKKLRRAWNLNHQVTQNVFKRVALVYKNKEESEYSSNEESEDEEVRSRNVEHEDLENMGDHFNRRSMMGQSMGTMGRRHTKKRGGLRRSRNRVEGLETGRNLRKTTRIKKKIEKERQKRQKKHRERRSRDLLHDLVEGGTKGLVGTALRPGVLIDRRKLEKVEFLDYTNKIIRKKQKGEDDDEEDFD
jgi:hypothetical protein